MMENQPGQHGHRAMANILIVYSTTDGHTRLICERLRQIVEHDGHSVVLVNVHNAADIDPGSHDKLVVGASIRYGKHAREVYDFIEAHQDTLGNKPNAFFSVNVVARKPEKRTPETNPYVRKFLGQIPWQPREIAVFAGKIDYPKYRFFDRMMIRLIMWMTGGPTDPKAVVEYTDWQQVENFGRRIAEM